MLDVFILCVHERKATRQKSFLPCFMIHHHHGHFKTNTGNVVKGLCVIM